MTAVGTAGERLSEGTALNIQASASNRARRSVSSDPWDDAEPIAVSSPPVSVPSAEEPCTVVIEDRTFFRECVLASLQAAEPGHDFQAFESVSAWTQSAAACRTSLLILWMSAPSMQPESDNVFADRLRQVQQLPAAPPIAVMSDHESADFIAHVMNSGARAFLPASMGLDMAVKVMDLVRAGGSFIPASTLAAMTNGGHHDVQRSADLAALLSPRQLDVARAMRKGLPNKVIAYELAMSESTVKVHVRTIMRKLKARNRTEVALLAEELDAGR